MILKNMFKVAAVALALLPQMAQASGGAALPEQKWEHHGVFGHFDNNAVKRGAQVAVEVCMGCHSIKYIKFDSLRQFGFTEAQVKAMAESQGRSKKDHMLSAMDAVTAKESFGVVPPDLSLMVKARKGYENYLFGILTGYLTEEESNAVYEAWDDEQLSEEEVSHLAHVLHMDPHQPQKMTEAVRRIVNGDNFNKYFPGHFLAMPKPLSAGIVEYADGTSTDLAQLARDTTTFLAWASEPAQTERKSLGIKVMIYLLILTAMLYAVKRRIWSRVKH